MSSHQENNHARVTQQAIDWFYRQDEGRLSPADQLAFTQWLAVEQHAIEYQKIAQVWSGMDELPLAAMLVKVERPLVRPGMIARVRRALRLPDAVNGRQTAWRTTCVFGVGTVLFVLGVWFVPLETEHVQTGKLAATSVTPLVLRDGTHIYANVDTRLTVRNTLLRRTVSLEQGEAFFEVTSNHWRPFTVATSRASVLVTGTSFNVLSLPQMTEVTVKTGHVEVSSTAGASASLSAGQMLSVNDHDATLLPSARQSWSWRDGIMIVQDAPLQEVMQRLQPYALPPVVFNDVRAPGYRLSGTIDLSQPGQFIHALPSLVPVRVLEKKDGTLMIVSRK